MITETFKKLDESKQRRIINAALKEFAENGYEQASTNRIVKEAGIGKGMLFYYFQNKDTLFQYLINYSIEFIESEFLNLIEMEQTDFIERLRQVARVKMQAYTEFPGVFNFMGTIFLAEASDLPTDLVSRINKIKKIGHAKIYENIDKSLFRDDVEVEKAFKLIKWSIEGFENELISKMKGKRMTSIQLDPYWDDFYEYLEIIKRLFYR